MHNSVHRKNKSHVLVVVVSSEISATLVAETATIEGIAGELFPVIFANIRGWNE
jgi:hypothetical protein